MTPRTQFESTEDFRARLGRAVAAKLGNRTRNLTCEIAAQGLSEQIARPHYDRDKKMVKFLGFETVSYVTGEQAVTVHRDEQQLGSYRASSALGTSRDVEATQINHLGLKWAMITDSSTTPELPMASQEAEMQWNDLSLAVIGDLELPYLAFDEKT